jgi:hypothetical protein
MKCRTCLSSFSIVLTSGLAATDVRPDEFAQTMRLIEVGSLPPVLWPSDPTAITIATNNSGPSPTHVHGEPFNTNTLFNKDLPLV